MTWRDAVMFAARSVQRRLGRALLTVLAVALAESGQTDKAKTEARLAPIPRTFGDATWEFLVYPGFWKIAP